MRCHMAWRLCGQAMKTGVVEAARVLQSASGVYRTLSGLGFIVADAVSKAEVGYAEPSTLALNTTIIDSEGNEICSNAYLAELPLEPRDGIPIAAWQPMVFFGGVVLAETVRMIGAWIEQEVVQADDLALGHRIVQGASDLSATNAAGGNDQNAVCVVPMPQSPMLEAREPANVIMPSQSMPIPDLTPNPWLKKLDQGLRLVEVAGSAASSVAMSAELFRAGIPLMPYFGFDDLAVAQPSMQSVQLQHQYVCDKTSFAAFAKPEVNYTIDAAINLPGVLVTDIEAKHLIGLLFKVGLATQIFSQVCQRSLSLFRQKVLVQQLAPALAQRAGETPQVLGRWLASQLFQAQAVAGHKVNTLAQRFEDVLFDARSSTLTCPRPSMDSSQSLREATINLLDRLANTALVASYAARLITTGVPYISSGFDGLRAGAAVKVPITTEKMFHWRELVKGDLKVQGEVLIPGSQLNSIQTSLFEPFIISALATKCLTIGATVAREEGGALAVAKGVRRTPWRVGAYLGAQVILRAGSMTTGALGAFGLSLFLGARIAADLVGGSKVESLGQLQGSFRFDTDIRVSNRPILSQQLSNETFKQDIATIELPNPSQITNITMLVGGLGGAGLLLMSVGIERFRQFLQRASPLAALQINQSVQSVEMVAGPSSATAEISGNGV